MGLADMLIKMGVKYGSQDSIDLCEHIAQTILNTATLASTNLACTRGTFPMYDYDSLKQSYFFRLNLDKKVQSAVAEFGMRNSQLLTIAPTGTLSTMLGISGGIEPIFANYYERKTESLHGEDRYYKVYTPIVKQYIESHNIKDDSQLPEYFVTAPNIKPIDRIKMQSIWQKYIDASISSTVNLPNEATVDDVAEIYLNAYKHGLKGITVFRDGCRRAGILSTKPKEENREETIVKQDSNTVSTPADLPRGYIIDTSDDLVGKKRKLQTGCGSLHCTAFFDPISGDLMETYLSRGSTGGCSNSYTGLSRMISLAARSGVGIDAIVDQLNSCGVCPSYHARTITKHDTSKGACCPIAIGKALKEMWLEMQEEIGDDEEEDIPKPKSLKDIKVDSITSIQIKDKNTNKVVLDMTPKDTCPECGEPLLHEGGCDICKNCGWSKCS